MKTRKRSLGRPTSVVIQHLLRLITRDCSRVKADLFVTVPLRDTSSHYITKQFIVFYCFMTSFHLVPFGKHFATYLVTLFDLKPKSKNSSKKDSEGKKIFKVI